MLALRLALRELRGGLRGFRIFLACLALGVAAIGSASAPAYFVIRKYDARKRCISPAPWRFASTGESACISVVGTLNANM